MELKIIRCSHVFCLVTGGEDIFFICNFTNAKMFAVFYNINNYGCVCNEIKQEIRATNIFLNTIIVRTPRFPSNIKQTHVKIYAICDNNEILASFQVNLHIVCDYHKNVPAIGVSTQTDLEVPAVLTNEVNLSKELTVCKNRMDALVKRQSAALFEVAKTRSLLQFIKSQRYLLVNRDREGNTAIHISILNYNFDFTTIFVEASLELINEKIIDQVNFKRQTPLMLACLLNEVELANFLIEAGANTSICDSLGCNVIHIACKNKSVLLLKAILARPEAHKLVNYRNYLGQAPLHYTIENDSWELFEELVNTPGANLNIEDARNGYTPLHYAAAKLGGDKYVKLLLNSSSIFVDAQACSGLTPLHLAIAHKNYKSTMLLLTKGASPRRSAFILYSSKPPLNALQSKLENGAEVDLLQLGREIAAEDFIPELAATRDQSFNAFHFADNDPWVIFLLVLII